METKLEVKIELEPYHEGGERPYLIIERREDGWFYFKFTDKQGRIVDPPPIEEVNLHEIETAFNWFIKISDTVGDPDDER